jgi:hypothetical protein
MAYNGDSKKIVSSSFLYSTLQTFYTKIKSALDGKAASSHTHNDYYDANLERSANTVLAAPNGSNGGATFRKLVAADLPSHTHSYLPLSGGNITNTINSSKVTNTYLAGNQGGAIINSTASAGAYVMLDKLNSTNGYFTDGVYGANRLLQYTAKDTVDAKTNATTKSVILLDESGNSSFPGTVTATNFSGKINNFTASAGIGYYLRPISYGTSGLTAGTSSLTTGYIYIQYE